MGREMRKILFSVATATALLNSVSAHAHEPGTPTIMPTGASIGVPVGANPPPGLYYSNRNEYFTGEVYNGDVALPIDIDVRASAQQFHWVPGNTILGGTYRAMVLMPIVWADQNSSGVESDQFALGDMTISPLNLSWMVAPGVFVQSGISFGLPTGEFSTATGSLNTGTNAFSTGFDVGFSYLNDGWNLSAHANYFIYGENPDTDYRSGQELLINWTAMKDIGGLKIGPVGYWRKQMTDDRNDGSFYGGTISGRAEQVGLGIGVSKQFGPVEVNLNYVHDFKVENTLGGDKVLLNLTMPLQF